MEISRQCEHFLTRIFRLLVLHFFCLIFLFGSAKAEEKFYAVGDTTGQDLYFVLTGATDKPVGHAADLKVVKPGTETGCDAFTLTPTTGTAADVGGVVRLPGTGSINAKPTSEFDKADRAQFLLTFGRDNLPAKTPAKWITVDTFTAVGAKFSPVTREGAPKPSIKYNVDTILADAVEVKPTGLPANKVFIELKDNSATNGDATLTTTTVGSGKSEIKIKGITQTTVGNSGKVLLVAKLDSATGKECGKLENGFSVCAHPTGVKTPTSVPSDDGVKFGTKVTVTFESDSGQQAHLTEVWDSEIVSAYKDQTGVFAGYAPAILAAGFMKIPETGPITDYYRDPKAVVLSHCDTNVPAGTNEGLGTATTDQLDIFYCSRCGMQRADAVVIRESGHPIVSHVNWKRDPNLVTKFGVEKQTAGVTVGAYSAEEGLTKNIAYQLHVIRP